MTITYQAQLVHEYQTLKALFIESALQGDEAQAKHILERMGEVSKQLDNLEVSQ